jgi:tRNA 2-thiouridine synthesizing protein D
MNIALNIHGGPANSQASATALRFAQAAIAAGHRLHRVFFYHDGVLAANQLIVPPQDESLASTGWVELAETHQIELAICIASALRRGLVDAAEQARYGLAAANVHPGFTVVGLGQLIEAIQTADRTVTFPA